MTMRRIGLALVTALLLAACAGDDQAADETDPAAASAPAVATSEPAPAGDGTADDTDDGSAAPDEGGVSLEVADSGLGQIVADAAGMTLYVFDNDSDGTSTCTGDCAANWPPLTGDATAGDGIDAALLGSTERDDGSVQVTYDGLPLYYFAGDQQAGDTTGQGMGGVWWVVAPDGAKITEEQVGQDDDSLAGGY